MGLESVRRQKKILDLLRQNSQITVSKLARDFAVSEVTIRRDMSSLAKAGKILRTYGGAASSEKVAYEFSFKEKLNKNIKEKEKIGNLTASLVKEGEVILMDSGTTTFQVAHSLSAKKNITVITNSLPVVSTLSGNPDIKIILLGGELQPEGFYLFGPIAEKELSKIYVDKSFIGTDGIDLEKGFYTTDFKLANLAGLMMKAAKKIIIVADHTKFNRKSFVLFGKLRQADIIVTDKNIDKKILRNLEKRRLKVLVT